MKGFIALTSVLIISVMLLAILVGASTSGLYARFNALERDTKTEGEALAESCAGIIRITLAHDPDYDGHETIPIDNGDTCIIGTGETNGTSESFFVSVVLEHLSTVREITIDTRSLVVIGDMEIPNVPE